MSVTLHIWVSIHHLIVFCCTSVKWWHISRCFFLFFKILVFWGVREGGGEMAKNGPKRQKKMSLRVSGTLPDCGFRYTCVKSWYVHFFFFFFFKILIFWVFQSSTINAKSKFWGVPHLHMCMIFVIHHDLIYEPLDP